MRNGGASRAILTITKPGLCSFAIFCFVLAITLPRASAPVSFAAALAAQLVAQGVMLRLMR